MKENQVSIEKMREREKKIAHNYKHSQLSLIQQTNIFEMCNRTFSQSNEIRLLT